MRYLLIASLFLSSFALADWKTLNKTEKYELFIDIDSMVIKGDKTRIWEKLNVFVNSTSVRTFTEYHCVDRTVQYLEYAVYDELDLSGNLLPLSASQKEDTFRLKHVAPNSTMEYILFAVCGN